MRMILVDIPLVLFALGWLFGQIRVLRTALFFIFWVVGCEVLVFISLNPLNPDAIIWALLGVALSLISIPMAILFGALTSRPITPAPIVVVAKVGVKVADEAHKAYQNLDPDQKEFVNRAARMGAKVGGKHFASFLRRNGWKATAGFVREASQFL